MVTTRRSKKKSADHSTSHRTRREKRRKAALCILGAVTGIVSVLAHIAPYLDRRPMNTSILTGEGWVQELLTGISIF